MFCLSVFLNRLSTINSAGRSLAVYVATVMGLKTLILDVDHSVMVLSILDITAAAWLLRVPSDSECSL